MLKVKKNIYERLFPLLILGLLLFTAGSIIFSVSIGQANIPLNESYRILLYKLTGIELGKVSQSASSYITIVWLLRFPRAIAAFLIGMGLALCGSIMQASVQNPLADPYILGISSGATLGATFAILVGFNSIPILSQAGVSMGAFAGALFASLLVLAIANIGGRITSSKLILSGMVVNAMFSAFSSIIVYFSNNSQGLKNVTFWIMGSMASVKWGDIPLLSIVVLAAALFFFTQGRTMNTMLMGDETATTLGINLGFYRKLYLTISALLTGIIVAQCGMIGFVGLIIPHITRSLVGSNHKKLLPLAVLTGGLFMIWTDLIARSMISGTEIPVGIITSAIGAPVFMYLLLKKNYEFGGN